MAIPTGWQKPSNFAGSSAPAIMVGLFVATGGILFGYDLGAVNGILNMREFADQFGRGSCSRPPDEAVCPEYQALIVSILSVGTVVGALLAAPSGDSLGRRITLLIGIAIFIVGAILQVCAEVIAMLLVGRCLAGVGVGLVSVLVPLYQSEMAPKWIRGTLVCAYQFSITIGLLAASIINMLTAKIPNSGAYRVPLGLQLLPALILTAGVVLLPETPRYLVKKGRVDEAGLSLSRLRRLDITHPALISELQEIIANHQYELTLGPDTYKELLRGTPNLGRRTLTGCILMMLQQLTGTNFVMYYSVTFFHASGIPGPYKKSIIMNAVNVVSTFPGLLVIESWGRRKMLIVGSIGMAFCQLFMASFSSAVDYNMEKVVGTLLIVFTAIDIFFYASTWGPVGWIVTSEIFPLKVRAKAMSLSTASNWIMNFGIAFSTPLLLGPQNAALGAKIFFIWGSFNVAAIFFVWAMVYETSKMSLEQIDEMYERVDRAWHSKGFEPSWSFQQIVDDHEGVPPGDHYGLDQQNRDGSSSQGTSVGLVDSAITVTDHGHDSEAVDNKDVIVMASVDFSY